MPYSRPPAWRYFPPTDAPPPALAEVTDGIQKLSGWFKANFWPAIASGSSINTKLITAELEAYLPAGIATGAGDRTTAEQALKAGLVLVPTAEPLWRDLLGLLSDEPARAAELARDAYDALSWHGLRPEPETDALIAHLLPGGTSGAVGGSA